MTDLIPAPEVDLSPLSAEEAEAVSKSVAQVDLLFPEIGFIDPTEELQKLRLIANSMQEEERTSFPDKIRAMILAHDADKTKPAVSDEQLCLAIYLNRLQMSALTEEDIAAKATGRKRSAAMTVEEKAAKKAMTKAEKDKAKLDELFKK